MDAKATGCSSIEASNTASKPLRCRWRQWMTSKLTADYLDGQAFYRMQASSLVDNPDQRISSDIRCVTALVP